MKSVCEIETLLDLGEIKLSEDDIVYDLSIQYDYEPLPHSERKVDTAELNQPAFNRWNTFTYAKDLSDADIYEVCINSW